MSDPRTAKIRSLELTNERLRAELLDVLQVARDHVGSCRCVLCRRAHAHGVVCRAAFDVRVKQMRFA